MSIIFDDIMSSRMKREKRGKRGKYESLSNPDDPPPPTIKERISEQFRKLDKWCEHYITYGFGGVPMYGFGGGTSMFYFKR